MCSKLTLVEILKKVLGLIKENKGMLLTIFILQLLMAYLTDQNFVGYFISTKYDEGISLLSLPIYFFVDILSFSLISALVTETSWKMAIGKILNFKTWYKLFIFHLILILACISGTLMFILPGILVLLWSSFGTLFILDKNTGIFETISSSFRLTNKNFLNLCILHLVEIVILTYTFAREAYQSFASVPIAISIESTLSVVFLDSLFSLVSILGVCVIYAHFASSWTSADNEIIT